MMDVFNIGVQDKENELKRIVNAFITPFITFQKRNKWGYIQPRCPN